MYVNDLLTFKKMTFSITKHNLIFRTSRSKPLDSISPFSAVVPKVRPAGYLWPPKKFNSASAENAKLLPCNMDER